MYKIQVPTWQNAAKSTSFLYTYSKMKQSIKQ